MMAAGAGSETAWAEELSAPTPDHRGGQSGRDTGSHPNTRTGRKPTAAA